MGKAVYINIHEETVRIEAELNWPQRYFYQIYHLKDEEPEALFIVFLQKGGLNFEVWFFLPSLKRFYSQSFVRCGYLACGETKEQSSLISLCSGQI